MSGKTIYVPQGYGAILIQTPQENLEGLYTDEFSTCTVIACLSQSHLLLIHADMQMDMEQIYTQISRIEDPNKKIVLLFKEKEGEPIKEQLFVYLKAKEPNLNVSQDKVKDDIYGIHLSFPSGIKKISFSNKPKNLIHHPREQALLYVQKISQVIGILHFESRKLKPFIVFNGVSWEMLSDVNFTMDSSHAQTKLEMAKFTQTDTDIEVAVKLMQIMEDANKSRKLFDDPETFAIELSGYLCAYLNNYDYPLVYKLNLKSAVNDDDPAIKPVTVADKKLKVELLKLLDKSGDVFNEIRTLINHHEDDKGLTGFFQHIIASGNTVGKFYDEGLYYNDIHKEQTKMRQEALTCSERAKQDYSQGKYASAEALFLDALKQYTYCSLNNDPALAMAYYDAGRCAYKNNKYEMAMFLIKTSLTMHEEFVTPKLSEQKMKSLQQALQMCENKWTQQLGVDDKMRNAYFKKMK